jgi:DNA-binding response OmpR family regulator
MTLPKHIVIVEDEIITQRYLQDIFKQFNVNVTGCFDNARDTLEALKKIECELLLLDINIKGPMDGIQLARNILREKTIPIVFITAHNDDDTLEEIVELAPYGFIGKPFSSKEIVVTLQIAYKRYLTHTELFITKEKEDITDIYINEKYNYSKEKKSLYQNNILIKLNQKQSILVAILADKINHVVNYDILVVSVWGDDHIADSALRTLVYSIRKILPDFPIVSHSKMGYMLQSEKL